MKKIVSMILVALFVSVTPFVVAAEIRDSGYTLYTFESGVPEGAVFQNANPCTAPGAYGKGLYVESAGGAASVSLPFSAEAGVSYRASVWVCTENEAQITICNIPLRVLETARGEGNWMYYEGTVVLPQNTAETAYFTVTADESFTIDDCLIYTEKRQAITHGNMVQNGTLDEDFSHWKTPNISVANTAGANGSRNAMAVTVLADWGCARADVRIDFGRTYKISWYAKAVSEDAVGLDMKYILDRVPYRQDMNTPMYFEKAIGKLTAEWQYFEVTHKELNLTTDQCVAELYFRAGSGRDKVTFAFDEVVVEEVDNTYEVDSYVIAEGNRVTREEVTASIYRQGNAEGVYYRFMNAFGDGYAVMDSGYTTEESASVALPEGYVGTCRTAINARDLNGVVGKTFFSSWTALPYAYEDDILTNIQETIWTPDTETLTAETVCRSTKDGETLTAFFAAYDTKGALVSVVQSNIVHRAGTKVESVVSAEGANSAKLMLFDLDTLKPVKQADEIAKTADGIFLYVDGEKGRDFHDGTAEAPLKTMSGAKVRVRDLLPEAKKDIYVVFREGEYSQREAISFTENDSSENVGVHYVAEKRGAVSITGGMDVENFALWDAENNIYRAYVGTEVRSRQFFVDGVRATRARNDGGLGNAVNLGKDGVGFTTTDTSLLFYKHIEDLEFCFFEDWTHSYVGVKSVSANEDGTVTVAMRDVDWYNQWNVKGNCFPSVPEYIENALELLNEEGEWYLDTHEGYLYYKPRVFEDLASVRCVLPVCETMLNVEGSAAQKPVYNMEFRGIVFENTTWNEPSKTGFCCGQNNKHFGGEERFIPGAIQVEHARGVAFTECRFARLGMTGLKMTGSLKNIRVVGNEFYDISGGALVVGDVFASAENPTPENPANPLYIVENIDITDNYMHKLAVDYKGGAGVSTSFPVNSNLSHNEVYDTSYSGFHLGWGWNVYDVTVTENFNVKGNYIHKVLNTDLFDGGGVYFLGRTNGAPEHPNRFEENYLYDIGNAFGAIYPDNGSTNWDILSNVCDMRKTPVWHRNFNEGDEGYNYPAQWLIIHMNTITDIFLDNNYTTTANEMNNGTVNVVNQNVHVYPDADWPEEAQGIIARSGAREQYQDHYRFGLQEVDTPDAITLKVGETKKLNLIVQTGKEKQYAPENYEVFISSKDAKVASYEKNEIVANSVGETEIYVYVKEADILKTKKIRVTVQ